MKTPMKVYGGRPQGSAYLDAIKKLGGRGTVDDVLNMLSLVGMYPNRDTVYQRLKQLQGEGRVVQDGLIFSLPAEAPTTDDRIDLLLQALVRAGVLPYDHGI